MVGSQAAEVAEPEGLEASLGSVDFIPGLVATRAAFSRDSPSCVCQEGPCGSGLRTNAGGRLPSSFSPHLKGEKRVGCFSTVALGWDSEGRCRRESRLVWDERKASDDSQVVDWGLKEGVQMSGVSDARGIPR